MLGLAQAGRQLGGGGTLDAGREVALTTWGDEWAGRLPKMRPSILLHHNPNKFQPHPYPHH